MLPIATILAALAIQHLSATTPGMVRGHWACTPVSTLVSSVAIDGDSTTKPRKPLVLDRKIKQDRAFVRHTLDRFKAKGLLAGFPDGLPPADLSSRWQAAIASHAALYNILEAFKNRRRLGRTIKAQERGLRDYRGELPDVMRLYSMFASELERLGAKLPSDVKKMNRVWLWPAGAPRNIQLDRKRRPRGHSAVT